MRLFSAEDFCDEKIKEAIDSFINKEKGDGKRGPFYNGSVKWIFDVDNHTLFQAAVWQGYLDASRTFTGIKTDENREAFDILASSIQAYFKNKDAEFEHDEWCKCYIKEIKRYNSYPSIRYGQAQKVVNMAFKYLYCCEGAEEYKEKFEPCHMPLDQYTLAWFFYEKGVLYQEWSWFDEKTYKKVAFEIKRILGTDVIGKELVIWQKFTDIKNPMVINLKTLGKKEVGFMKVRLKGIDGMYTVGECGVVDLDAYEDQETAVENRDYGNFEKKELYWTIYDQIILPIRNAEGVDPDHSIRLLFIEDDGDKMILHYNIDDYDESYCEIPEVANKTLDEVMDVIYEDFCGMGNALPDGEPLKGAITWDKSGSVNIPDDCLERLKKDVFYSTWEIESIEE